MSHWLFTLSMLVINLRPEAQAIGCYLCESAYAANCGVNFELEAAFKFDCSRVPPPRYLENELLAPNATACMKRIYSESGVEKVVRSCFFGDVNDTRVGCKTDPALTATVFQLSCDVCDNENYCNSAALPFNQFLLLALSLTFTQILALLKTP